MCFCITLGFIRSLRAIMSTAIGPLTTKTTTTLDDYLGHPKLIHLITTSFVTTDIITIAKHR